MTQLLPLAFLSVNDIGLKKHLCHPFRLISSELSCSDSECTVKRPSSPWLRPIRQDSVATYFVLIGRSDGELDRCTVQKR